MNFDVIKMHGTTIKRNDSFYSITFSREPYTIWENMVEPDRPRMMIIAPTGFEF